MSVTCITAPRYRPTPAETSAALTSIILATVTKILRVLLTTTTSADSAILTCYVTRFFVTPAICTADTTNQIRDGRCTIYTVDTSKMIALGLSLNGPFPR